MHRQLRWGWLWAALYAISGALFLLAWMAHALELQSPHYLYVCFAIAGFVGAASVSALTGGRSMREGMIAAMVVALVSLALVSQLLTHGSAGRAFCPLVGKLGILLVFAPSALAGGHLGGLVWRNGPHPGKRLAQAFVGALVLIGAFAVHGVVIALLGLLSDGLAVLLCLLGLFATPALAGAALQLASRQDAEAMLARGVTATFLFLFLLVTLETQNLGILMLFGLGFTFLGATLYGFSLSGVFTVRSADSWHHPRPELPVAKVVSRPAPAQEEAS